ncbi:MAG: Gfo/Idh/MocA family oxidoreductase [Lachnospiraceae bacterium]|nr:Gfo/Idh/MocA family oxidoreductase [Lachnospiraceae bacterium]
MIRIAVVGSGMLVHEIMPMLKEMPQIHVQVLVGTKRSADTVHALQEQYAIPEAYTDYDRMLADKRGQLDLVYLATPNYTHFELAMKAIDAGFHIFIEKPLTLSLSEAEQIFSKAREKGVIALEAISNRYLPVCEVLKRELKRAGQIKYVSLNFSQYSSRYDRFMAGEYFRVFDAAAGGGALLDLGIYNIHIAAFLFGRPAKTVYCPNIIRDVDVSGVMLMDYTDFKVVSVAAKDCQGDNGLLIEGTDGYFKLSDTLNSMNAPLIFHDRKTGEDIVLSEGTGEHRMTAEFRTIEQIIQKKDVLQVEERQSESMLAMHMLQGIH